MYLDVWTPDLKTRPAKPVMVWTHGGGNVAGAGGFDPLYDGRALFSRGVVLVVLEYPLGIFGFFSLPVLTAELPHHASGNYGILDQVAALQWVHTNIAHFGDDPSNVTIFGQSAGSTDVLGLMAFPLSRGLFHRAIAESDPLPSAARSQTLSQAEEGGVTAAAMLNVPTRGQLAFLRSLPTQALLHTRSGNRGLTADGWVFPTFPLRYSPRAGKCRFR